MLTSNRRRDARLNELLRSLDAADGSLTDEQLARKDTALTAILATSPAPLAPRGGTPLRRPVLRWAVPVAAAAGLAFALTMTGGPQGGAPAYASWTPQPRPVDGDTLAVAERACRDGMRDSLDRGGDVPPELRPTLDPASARTVVAEQRGNFLFLAMVAADSSTVQCFFDAADPATVRGSTGALATAGSPTPGRLAPGQVDAGGAGMSGGPEGTYAYTQGRVGPGATGVTIRTEGRTIAATVSDGHFAAWWPSTVDAGMGRGPALAFDVILADGTVVRDARNLSQPPGSQPATLGPRQIGDIARGGGVGEDGEVLTVEGRVGSQVTGVTVHVGSRSGGRTVSATVRAGAFSAEWPRRGSEDLPPLTYDVTLDDGTVLRNQ